MYRDWPLVLFAIAGLWAAITCPALVVAMYRGIVR